ncbi:MAG: hypothetical protein HZC44_10155 [Geobacter sp.]|nr:hypothetical protein [Geobacter sp.]
MPGLMTIKKEFFERIGGFDENLSGYEDDDLFLRLYGNGRIFYLPHATLRWRIYGDNYSFSHRMLTSRTYYWKKLLRDYTDNGVNRFRVHMISQRFFLEFVGQAIFQKNNGNELYKKSLGGAKSIISYLPVRQNLIFRASFILPPSWLVFFLRYLTGR